MPKILNTKSLYYNDVNLIAQAGRVNSRSEVPKELNRIIVAPMDAVVGYTFAHKANKLGLTVCLHRFCEPDVQANLFYSLPNKQNVFVSVGANDLERVKRLAKQGAKNFLLDIANGYVPNIQEIVAQIKGIVTLDKLMVGNIMTWEGYSNLADLHEQTYIRVGIAGGSACSTSDTTGYNRGSITELMEINEGRNKISIKGWGCSYCVADGGIKNGGYAAKAFGASAEYIMMGGYFARAEEAETHIIGDGTYWGGASHKQQARLGGIKKHSEGKVYEIQTKPEPLEKLVNELWGSLSSAISYSGYNTLTSFIGNGVFEIKQNSLPPKNR